MSAAIVVPFLGAVVVVALAPLVVRVVYTIEFRMMRRRMLREAGE